MKWNEMTTAQKWLLVIGWLCGIAYLILDILVNINVIDVMEERHRVLKAIWFFSYGVWQKNISNGWHVFLYILALWELFVFVMSFVAF